jgi:succinate dehydrogenase / fumarate reductase membrane anchor subunit
MLALGHLIIMHLLNNVDHIDYDFVAGRYAGWFWRGYDLLMLVLAMLHGLNGVRILIDDYVHSPGPRRLAVRLLYTVGGVFLVLGVYAVVGFRP